LPTVRVDLVDTKITLKQKRELARSLTRVVSETLGDPKDRVMVVFNSRARTDVARGGILGS
jgi:phenylpyruvate tautomerase PptA (4-oxalocrotonate tautomerase family)